MKKYAIIIALLCSITIVGQTQPILSCVRNISTNPKNPSNNEWGTTIFPGISDYYLNTGFDWYPPNFGPPIIIDQNQNWAAPYSSQNNPILMKSPYRTENGNGSKYLWAKLTDLEEADFRWEDGWELLFMNLGYYSNGDKISANKKTNELSV